MKQFTKEEAIKFAESGIWKDWQPEQIVGLQLYQRMVCVDWGEFHKATEQVLGRPVWTHEFGLSLDQLKAEFEGKRPPPTFDEIMNLIPEDKKVIFAMLDEEQDE